MNKDKTANYDHINVKFHIVLPDDDIHANSPHRWRYYHYKSCAAYAVSYVAQSATYTGLGSPRWGRVEIVDSNGAVVADTYNGVWDAIVGLDVYPAALYVLASVRNEKQRIVNWSEEWLSPSEVEDELAIRAGTVRQYINRKREVLLQHDLIKETDGRTTLIKRGKAYNMWQTQRQKFVEDTNEWSQIVDIASNSPVWRDRAPLKPELYEVLNADTSPVKNDVVMINDVPHLRYSNELDRLKLVKLAVKYLSTN
jgi:hypothetical protein